MLRQALQLYSSAKDAAARQQASRQPVHSAHQRASESRERLLLLLQLPAAWLGNLRPVQEKTFVVRECAGRMGSGSSEEKQQQALDTEPGQATSRYSSATCVSAYSCDNAKLTFLVFLIKTEATFWAQTISRSFMKLPHCRQCSDQSPLVPTGLVLI